VSKMRGTATIHREKVSQVLPVHLTDRELLGFGKDLADEQRELDRIEDAKKEANDSNDPLNGPPRGRRRPNMGSENWLDCPKCGHEWKSPPDDQWTRIALALRVLEAVERASALADENGLACDCCREILRRAEEKP